RSLGGHTDASEVHGAAADVVAGINGTWPSFQSAGWHGDCVARTCCSQLSLVDGGITVDIAECQLSVTGGHGVAIIHGNGAVICGIGCRGSGIVAVVGTGIGIGIDVRGGVEAIFSDRVRAGFGEGVGFGDRVVAVVGAGIDVYISIEVDVGIGLGDGIRAGLGDRVIAVVSAGIDIGIDVGSVGRSGVVAVIGTGIQCCIQVQGVADQVAVFHAGAAIVCEVDIVK